MTEVTERTAALRLRSSCKIDAPNVRLDISPCYSNHIARAENSAKAPLFVSYMDGMWPRMIVEIDGKDCRGETVRNEKQITQPQSHHKAGRSG